MSLIVLLCQVTPIEEHLGTRKGFLVKAMRTLEQEARPIFLGCLVCYRLLSLPVACACLTVGMTRATYVDVTFTAQQARCADPDTLPALTNSVLEDLLA